MYLRWNLWGTTTPPIINRLHFHICYISDASDAVYPVAISFGLGAVYPVAINCTSPWMRAVYQVATSTWMGTVCSVANSAWMGTVWLLYVPGIQMTEILSCQCMWHT